MGLTGVWLRKCKYGCLSLPIVTVSWGDNKSTIHGRGATGLLTYGWLIWGSAASPSTAWGKARMTAGDGTDVALVGRAEGASPVMTLWARVPAGHLA